MEEMTRLELIKSTIFDLSKENKKITVKQIKEVSGIENPQQEIEYLRNKGIIMQLKSGDIMWV